jgi:protein O-GlcNAc transferase
LTGQGPPGRSARRHDAARAFAAGLALHQQGRLREAEALYRAALLADPAHGDSLHHLGVLHAQRGDLGEAVRLIQRAVDDNPRLAEARNDLGVALAAMGRTGEAVAHYEAALAQRPRYAAAHANLGTALERLERHQEAVAHYETAIAIEPTDATTPYNLANALQSLDRPAEAVERYRQALALKPDYAEAHNNLGVVLRSLNRIEEAVAHLQRAVALAPRNARAHDNLGRALQQLGRQEAAVESYRRAIALKPDFADACNSLGTALEKLERFEEAIAAYRRAHELDPKLGVARSNYVMLRQRICDWATAAEDVAGLVAALESDERDISPFVLVTRVDDPAIQLKSARNYVRDLGCAGLPSLWRGALYGHEKIRVAYLSSEFRHHATSFLMAELLELHDRDRFEITGISWGPDDGTPMRRRVERAFDRFVEVGGISDEEAAQRIHDLEIDVAVYLNGFMQGSRPKIPAYRPAPIQASFLGYPATMGADFIDYLLVDRFIVPADQQEFFTERLVHLPDCYQPNDRQRAIAEQPAARSECGLPERGFVFACFNNTYKITPDVFDVWMRLLTAVPDSVLWLLAEHPAAIANLRNAAVARDVAPDRLVFAPSRPLAEHLARHRLADLFLDAFPYTAHTTASDALWAGVPLLTCTGRSFATRVAGSLLHTIGLPELVVENFVEYEAMALRLARRPELLAAFRQWLAEVRSTTPLFNTDRFRRHLEEAYERMREILRAGGSPRPFTVPAISS